MTQYPIPMGQEIDQEPEEAANNQKQQNPKLMDITAKLKNFLLHLKRPKPITLIILFVTVILISIALNFLSKTNKEEAVTPAAFQSGSPSPNSSVDPGTENIAQRVKVYTEKLNSLKSFQTDLPKPIVDLDISFK